MPNGATTAEPRHPRDLHVGLDSEIVRTRASRFQKPRLFPASEQPLAARVTPDCRNLSTSLQKGLALAREESVAVVPWPVEPRRET